MPRVARIVISGNDHHVTQRARRPGGSNRQDVFFTDDDRRAYVAFFGEQPAKHAVRIVAHCLMTNHVHLVVSPPDGDALAKAIGRTQFLYAQYVNRLHRRSGHLWQNRFHSCVLDDSHLANTMAYVERNPVRAGIVRQAWDYPWSSAAAHVSGSDPAGILDLAAWRVPPAEWRRILQKREDDDFLTAIRNRTSTGRPLATDSALSKLEALLNKRLRPLPGGRPRKEKAGGEKSSLSGKGKERKRRGKTR